MDDIIVSFINYMKKCVLNCVALEKQDAPEPKHTLMCRTNSFTETQSAMIYETMTKA